MMTCLCHWAIKVRKTPPLKRCEQLGGVAPGGRGLAGPLPGTAAATAGGELLWGRPCSTTPRNGATDGPHVPAGASVLRSQVPLPTWPARQAPPAPPVLGRALRRSAGPHRHRLDSGPMGLCQR